MYITLQEIANKFNMTSEESLKFANYALTNHRHLVMNNPDVSVSSVLESHVMKDGWDIRTIVCNSLSRPDVKKSGDIERLRQTAIEAVATFFAEYNKANFEDFKTDMRLDNMHNDCPRSLFMSDLDTITDVVDNLLLNEVVALLPDLQA